MDSSGKPPSRKRKRAKQASWKLGKNGGKTGSVVVRPEVQCQEASEWFNSERSERYASSDHVKLVQNQLTDSAWSIIKILCSLNPKVRSPRLILDCGSGSGFSAERLRELNEQQQVFVFGYDVSESMVNLGMESRASTGKVDFAVADMRSMPVNRNGVDSRPRFDSSISISAVQWLFTWDEGDAFAKGSPYANFLLDLHHSLEPHGCAVLQFYPANSLETVRVCEGAELVGFNSFVVMDYPHREKNSKYFLCLTKDTPTPEKVRRTGNACLLSKGHQCPCVLQLLPGKFTSTQGVKNYDKLEEEHFKLAHRLVRLKRRINAGGKIDGDDGSDREATRQAMERLDSLFQGIEKVTIDAVRSQGSTVIDALHFIPKFPDLKAAN